MLYWHSLECFSRLAATTHPGEKVRASKFDNKCGETLCFVLSYFTPPPHHKVCVGVRFLVVLCLSILFFQGRKVSILGGPAYLNLRAGTAIV